MKRTWGYCWVQRLLIQLLVFKKVNFMLYVFYHNFKKKDMSRFLNDRKNWDVCIKGLGIA